MATFKEWTNPKDSTARVYVDGLGGQRGCKIWAERCAVDSFGSDFVIKTFASNLNKSEQGNLANDAEQAIDAALGKRAKLFDDVRGLVA